MNFSLYYKGPLPVNAKIEEKHAIRKALHYQIKEVFNLDGFEVYKTHHPNAQPDQAIKLGGIEFIPFVPKDFRYFVRLNITLFKPERVGGILTKSGDLDNKLKTLFDALCLPQEDVAVRLEREANATPIYCLVQEDSQIGQLNIATHQWMAPPEDVQKSDVILLVEVELIKDYIESVSYTS